MLKNTPKMPLDVGQASAQMAVLAMQAADNARLQALIVKHRAEIQRIDAAGLPEEERVLLVRALDDEMRPVAARIGLAWESHIVVRSRPA